jgi:hypothetical protein
MIRGFKINGIPHAVKIERHAEANTTAVYRPRYREIAVNTHFWGEDEADEENTPRHEMEMLNDLLHEIMHCLFTHVGSVHAKDEIMTQTCANALQQIITSAEMDYAAVLAMMPDAEVLKVRDAVVDRIKRINN